MGNEIKIVTIGGGSGYTPELVKGFINRVSEFPIKEIWLVDVEEGRNILEIISKYCKKIIERSGLDIQIVTSYDRRQALIDADFVLTHFRAGQLDAREKDETIPLKYRMVGQETNGPGEVLNALRSIPVILDIVKDMEELCPKAWLINFANPAGILAQAVLGYSNFNRMISICNGPLNIKVAISNALGVDSNRLFVEFIGLNHLVFAKKILLDEVYITKEFVFDLAKGKYQIDTPGSGRWNEEFLICLNAIPISYLQYYWKKNETIEKEIESASKEGARAQVAKLLEKELFHAYQNELEDQIPLLLSQRGGAGYSECACELIVSIYNDKRDIQIVNTLNNGAISDLENDDVVELNCVITSGGAIPLATGKSPDAMKGIIQQMKAFEKLVCEAAIEGDYNKALVAMTINPTVQTDTNGKKVLDEMLLANEIDLPQFDLSFLKVV